MKQIHKSLHAILPLMIISTLSFGQKIDEQRMQRDIEVVENVLGTLLRQQFDRQQMFFPIEINGSYQPGYGVTFRLPADFTTPILFSMEGDFSINVNDNVVWNTPPPPPGVAQSFSYSYSEGENEMDEPDEAQAQQDKVKSQHDLQRAKNEKTAVAAQKHQTAMVRQKAVRDKEKVKEKKRVSLDSVRDSYNNRVIEASKNFMADYGDLISQLQPTEKVVITNEGQQPHMWVGKLMNAPNRTHLSIEALKGDVTQYKMGKLTRDQLMAKIKVVNTETVETVEPDIELLSSIFDRLYQPDLSRTYFTEDKIYYERLKDYGVVYYMQVYSSHQQDQDHFNIPTLREENLGIDDRNKKVAALYPSFENELKENILEYGRTVRSLQDNEVMIFNVKLTKCPSCAIPSTLELTIKGSVLKDYASGKLDKNAAIGKLSIKKGDNQ